MLLSACYTLLFTCYCRLINRSKVFSCTAVCRNCSSQPWSWLIIKHSSLNFGGKKCTSSLCFQVLSVITSQLLQVEELCLKLMSPVHNRRLRHLSHRSGLFMTERSLIIALCAGSLIAINLLATKALYSEASLGFMSVDSHHFSFSALQSVLKASWGGTTVSFPVLETIRGGGPAANKGCKSFNSQGF